MATAILLIFDTLAFVSFASPPALAEYVNNILRETKIVRKSYEVQMVGMIVLSSASSGLLILDPIASWILSFLSIA